MLDYSDIPMDETPPEPGAMINTFRAFGYNLQTAVADIVDNSISAEAKSVKISYEWHGGDSWMTITDDGVGMNRDELVVAMKPGSRNPEDERDKKDLGRFGLGLKTASFSQCKVLTVISKKEGHQTVKRCWDLDFVNRSGKWNLLDFISDEAFMKEVDASESGTTVLWQKLDRLVGNAHVQDEATRKVFLEEFERLEEHLSLVFHRYIETKRIVIEVNGQALSPWDPFLRGIEGAQLIAKEDLDNDQVRIKCYAIPHISKLTPDQRKIAKVDEWYKMQGFYVYRNDRLLLFGDWLGLVQKNEQYKNARIQIDIPNKLDHEWKIDIKKATATPSIRVRKDLIRLAKLTRKAASKIHRFRGNQILLNTEIDSDFHTLWKATKSRDGSRHYFINEGHPLINKLLEHESVSTRELKRSLKLIGEMLPVESIIQNNSEDPESHELRSTDSELSTSTAELAKLVYESLLSSGVSKENAFRQLMKIEPFNLYPELVEIL